MKNLPNSDIKNIICVLIVFVTMLIKILPFFVRIPVDNQQFIKDVDDALWNVVLIIVGHYLTITDIKKTE